MQSAFPLLFSFVFLSFLFFLIFRCTFLTTRSLHSVCLVPPPCCSPLLLERTHISTRLICLFLWNVCIPQLFVALCFGGCYGGGRARNTAYVEWIEKATICSRRHCRGFGAFCGQEAPDVCEYVCVRSSSVYVVFCAGMLKQGWYVQHVKTGCCYLPAASQLLSCLHTHTLKKCYV